MRHASIPWFTGYRGLLETIWKKGLPYLKYLAATLVSVAFFWKLPFLSNTLRWGVAFGVLLLGCIYFALLSRLVVYAKLQRWSIWLALGFSATYFVFIPAPTAKAITSTVTLSDLSVAPASQPTPVAAWGKVMEGYILHPAFEGTVTPNALSVTLLPSATFAKLWVAQPASSLLNADGRPTNGDGIGLTVTSFDASGVRNGTYAFALSQADFLSRKWISVPLWRNLVVGKMEITVDPGPTGSTPAFDTTLLSLRVTGFDGYFQHISAAVLLALGAFTLIFSMGFLATYIPSLIGERSDRRAFAMQFCAALLISAAYVFWQQTQSQFVYYWDYLNYWSKTEAAFSMMQAHQWGALFSEVLSSLSANYSAIPALPVALLEWVVGTADQVSYAVIVSLIYTVPAYFMLVLLAKRVMISSALGQQAEALRWEVSWISLMFIFPLYFGTTLLLMPDIGGVSLIVLAIILAESIVSMIRDETQPLSFWKPSARLIFCSISLSVLLAMSFLFRRWYVFAAAGILGAMACLLSIDFVRLKRRRWSITSQSYAVVVVALFPAISLLCWTLFSWGMEVENHDYASLYASYNLGLTYAAQKLVALLGIIPICTSIAGLAVGLWSSRSSSHIWLLILSTVISIVLFLSIQSPGRHHFYLLMPLLAVGFLIALWTVVVRWGGLAATLAMAVMVLGGAFVPRYFGVQISPGYRDLMPKQQPYAKDFVQIATWLNSAEIRESSFCVIASSLNINQSVFSNLWQIYPPMDRLSSARRLVVMNEVDRIHGSPAQSLKQCDVFLVATPFQHHLLRENQFSVEILQKELSTGQGLGADVDRFPAREWDLGDGIRITAYRRNRPTSDAAYGALVERYRVEKALANASGQ